MRTKEAVDLAAGRAVRRGVTALAARARAERPGVLTSDTVAVLGQLGQAWRDDRGRGGDPTALRAAVH